jgi:hypothetical protein
MRCRHAIRDRLQHDAPYCWCVRGDETGFRQQVPPTSGNPIPPAFLSELGGVGHLHAAFLIESRNKRPWMGLRRRKSGVPRILCEGWDSRISIQTFAYPTLCKERKGWGTRRLVALPSLPNMIENLFLFSKCCPNERIDWS